MGIPDHGVAEGDEVSINCTMEAPANSAVNVTALYLNAQDESGTSETAVVEAKIGKEDGKALLTSGTNGTDIIVVVVIVDFVVVVVDDIIVGLLLLLIL